MSLSDSPTRPEATRPTPFAIESVDWSDPRAEAMRDEMNIEMHNRYFDALAGTDPEHERLVEKALAVDPADIVATVIAVDHDGSPIGHAAVRLLRGMWEVKRVIVSPAARGRGVAVALMNELQRIASDAGQSRLILQTGDRQPEAVALYEKLGFTRIPIYEPYVEAIPFSICFEKTF